MKLLIKILSITLVLTSFNHFGWTNELTQIPIGLDAPYNYNFPKIKRSENKLRPIEIFSERSDVASVLALQSPVKTQGFRGTCSIFSATAYLEYNLIKQNAVESTPDLSEEWLQYLNATLYRRLGSHTPDNINMYRKYGAVQENELPYLGEEWEKLSDSYLAEQRCGSVPQDYQLACLYGHWDPRFLNSPLDQISDLIFANAIKSAFQFRNQLLTRTIKPRRISNESELKKLLAEGRPVIVDVDFYYGSWNHRLAPGMGIERNMNQWTAGLVSYPEKGSLDRLKSEEKRAGHSILIIGYDDEKIIRTDVQMQNGTKQTFEHKGVFYFKNSWGTDSFGVKHELSPGYGTITQDYAFDFGQFFFWEL